MTTVEKLGVLQIFSNIGSAFSFQPALTAYQSGVSVLLKSSCFIPLGVRYFNPTRNLGNPKSWSYKAKALRYSEGRVSFTTNEAGKSHCLPKAHHSLDPISEAVLWGPPGRQQPIKWSPPSWYRTGAVHSRWEDTKWEWRNKPKAKGKKLFN